MRYRLYTELLSSHFRQCRQMAFVTGPRQVGKATTCRELGDVYFDWDNDNHRRPSQNLPVSTELAGLTIMFESPAIASNVGSRPMSGGWRSRVTNASAKGPKYRAWSP